MNGDFGLGSMLQGVGGLLGVQKQAMSQAMYSQYQNYLGIAANSINAGDFVAYHTPTIPEKKPLGLRAKLQNEMDIWCTGILER